MVNCETRLNSMKARVWGLKDPVAVDKWNANCGRMTQASAENAIKVFELVWGVWQYLNNAVVRSKLLNVHIAVADFLGVFEELYREHTGAREMDLEGRHWREYMMFHFGRMLKFSAGWAEGRLNQLVTDWTAQLNLLLQRASAGANVAKEIGIAMQALTAFNQHTQSLSTTFTFNTQLFQEN